MTMSDVAPVFLGCLLGIAFGIPIGRSGIGLSLRIVWHNRKDGK